MTEPRRLTPLEEKGECAEAAMEWLKGFCDDGDALGDIRAYVAALEQELAAAKGQQEVGTCLWTYDSMADRWDTDCGHAFCFNNDEGPVGNDMRYCPFCGGKLVEEECADDD